MLKVLLVVVFVIEVSFVRDIDGVIDAANFVGFFFLANAAFLSVIIIFVLVFFKTFNNVATVRG